MDPDKFSSRPVVQKYQKWALMTFYKFVMIGLVKKRLYPQEEAP
jgi:hypothetical protein